MSVALYSAELDDRLLSMCSNHSEFTPTNENYIISSIWKLTIDSPKL